MGSFGKGGLGSKLCIFVRFEDKIAGAPQEKKERRLESRRRRPGGPRHGLGIFVHKSPVMNFRRRLG